MTRRKALTIAVSVIGVSGLIFALLLVSTPSPALSYASYKWKPGCHCGSPPKTVTTTKKPTTAAAKPTTTTTKKAAPTTTAKPAAKAATITTAKPATKAATTTSKASLTKKATAATSGSKASTTSTSTKTKKKSAKSKLALGALAAGFADPGSGGPADGAGGPDGSAGGSDDPSGTVGENGDAATVNAIDAGPQPPHYYLSPVAIIFLLIYGVSFALYRAKRMRVTTHRRIWNVLLLATFLMCGLLGLVLAVGITRDPPLELPTWLFVWHVETGVAMCFISIFHIGWHLRYYLAVLTGKRKAGREPAAERARASRPQTGRLGGSRTAAERVLAFEKRHATRAQAAEPKQRGVEPRLSDAERWLRETKRSTQRGGSLVTDPLAD